MKTSLTPPPPSLRKLFHKTDFLIDGFPEGPKFALHGKLCDLQTFCLLPQNCLYGNEFTITRYLQ